MTDSDQRRPFARVKAGETVLPLETAEGVPIKYFVSDELAEAANVALFLQRPLLVTGEPGTGKTLLAHALAAQLELGEVLDFSCKSDSVGRDLLYRVDHVRRLHDAYAAREARTEPASIERYISYAALGEAIRAEQQRLVLIDEIDKAPTDFPNDLLNELERAVMHVPELDPSYKCAAKHRPVVVITSNRERHLPKPFLRRCVFHHIEYPDDPELARIVRANTRNRHLAPSFVDLVIQRFREIRRITSLAKQPATDELIAWTDVLHEIGVSEKALAETERLGELPGLQAVIKHAEDLEVLKRVGTGASHGSRERS